MEKREEFLNAFAPIADKFIKLQDYTYPVNRRIARQLLGFRLFGISYLLFILARLHLILNFPISAKTFWGGVMRVPADRTGTELYYLHALPEHKLIRYLIRTLKVDDVFYDIGASYGFYAVMTSELITAGEVHVFEPLPRAFAVLKNNLASYRNAYPSQVAVTKADGPVTFFNVKSFSTQSSTRKAVADTTGIAYEPLQVAGVMLDTYVKTHKAPTIIKIDVEGGEAGVLRGGEHFIRSFKPVIVMEVWGGEQGKRFSSEAVQLVRSWGYDCYEISDTGELRLQPAEDLVQATSGDNFVFIARSNS